MFSFCENRFTPALNATKRRPPVTTKNFWKCLLKALPTLSVLRETECRKIELFYYSSFFFFTTRWNPHWDKRRETFNAHSPLRKTFEISRTQSALQGRRQKPVRNIRDGVDPKLRHNNLRLRNSPRPVWYSSRRLGVLLASANLMKRENEVEM